MEAKAFRELCSQWEAGSESVVIPIGTSVKWSLDRCRLVFRRYSVRIPIGTPAILTEVFRSFPQSLQANSRIGHDYCLPNPFQFIVHHSLRGLISAYIGCFKKSFTTLKEYIKLFRGHVQCFEMS
jgi:hypothetical protein